MRAQQLVGMSHILVYHLRIGQVAAYDFRSKISGPRSIGLDHSFVKTV